ncbi:MAG: CAP domain-containing protein [Fimbriiglobus sp.]|nr:CAP domain-containing protein [Fimbriiglobus sp.]
MTRRLLALCLLVAAVGCTTPERRPPRGQMPTPPPDADAVQAVIDRTNAERRRAGVPPLSIDPQLTLAAEKHAADMARRNQLSHTLNGRSVADRVRAAGYEYRAVGENIAWNQPTAAEAVGDWMTSSGHRKNLLNREFTHIGVAVANNSRGEPYWVQVFGRPR